MYKYSKYKIGICHDIFEYENMKKYFDYVILENVRIINSFNGPKSTIGILENNNRRYFFKEKNNNTIKEVEGFNILKQFYKTPSLCIETDKYIVPLILLITPNANLFFIIFLKFFVFFFQILAYFHNFQVT